MRSPKEENSLRDFYLEMLTNALTAPYRAENLIHARELKDITFPLRILPYISFGILNELRDFGAYQDGINLIDYYRKAREL